MTSTPNYVGGIGPLDAKIAVIGEAPGAEEDQAGIPFCGPSGRLLNQMLAAAGTKREDCYISNVVKYRPPFNDIKKLSLIGVDLEQQKKQLYEELSKLRPNVVIAVGGTAMETLTHERGVKKYRGSILVSKISGIKVVPIIHPRNIITPKGKGGVEYFYKFISIMDIQKAVRESKTPELNLPKRFLQIIKNPYQLYKFLEEYKNCSIVCLDLETSNSIPICMGLAFNSRHGASVPLFSLESKKSRIDLSKSDQVEIWYLLSNFLNKPDLKFLGQNFKFDHQLLIRPLKMIEYEPNRLYADTSLMMEVAYPELPKNLGFMTSIFTDEPFYKDEGREFNWKTDKVEQLLTYNCKDVTIPWDVHDSLLSDLTEVGMLDFYFNYENKLHDFYMELENEGILRDEARRDELLAKFKQEEKLGDKELADLLNIELNVNSPKKVSEAVFGILKLPHRETTGEDDLVSLLGFLKSETAVRQKYDIDKCSRALDLILKLRQVKKAIGTYLEIEPDSDGFFRSSYRISSKKGDDK